MNRRTVLWSAALIAMCHAARAHTPYGQWVVYRKKHLLIGAHRADPETYARAKQLATLLARELPKSKSRVARAPNVGRLASLIGTGQLDVAVLNRADAVAMLHGSPPFTPYGAISLRLLALMGDYVLVAHERFPERHAALVAEALSRSALIRQRPSPLNIEIEWHSGVSANHKK